MERGEMRGLVIPVDRRDPVARRQFVDDPEDRRTSLAFVAGGNVTGVHGWTDRVGADSVGWVLYRASDATGHAPNDRAEWLTSHLGRLITPVRGAVVFLGLDRGGAECDLDESLVGRVPDEWWPAHAVDYADSGPGAPFTVPPGGFL